MASKSANEYVVDWPFNWADPAGPDPTGMGIRQEAGEPYTAGDPDTHLAMGLISKVVPAPAGSHKPGTENEDGSAEK